MKNISILGSTGSIGTATLEIISQFPESFRLVGLAAGKNLEKVCEQVKCFEPAVASVQGRSGAEKLQGLLGSSCNSVDVLFGEPGMIAVATHPDTDLVVSATVGHVGLIPTLAAIRAGKQVALANKEILVVGGRIVMEEARSRGIAILPVDSEHSAIFQALQGHRREDVRRILLTASGGPFLHRDPKEGPSITPELALAHPVWPMGEKVTIDSATMMNKGLEVIEAHWLFDLPPEKIEVVIHPQSIIHSMVEYRDASTIAQMSVPDMKIPISYALAYPGRIENGVPFLTLPTVGELTFMEPDLERFPALRLAYQALREEESMCAVLNGANEAAVEAFLQRRLPFMGIPKLIEQVMDCHNPRRHSDINDALEVNTWAYRVAHNILNEH